MREIKTKSGIRCMVNETEGNLPLLVFLHGIGERGTNIKKVMKYGPLKQLEDGIDIGEPKIIVHPLLESGNWTVQKVDDVIESFKYMSTKVYLMGVSLGGLGVWTYAQSREHVKKLDAIVPICGGGNDPSKANVLVEAGIAGWAAHAKNDPTVPYTTTKRMVETVNNLAGRSQILFSEYGMFGHSAWNYFLKPEYGVYSWLKYQNKENSFSYHQGFNDCKTKIIEEISKL